ncbi:MAG: nucleotide exchange factor GrpE [Anaerovorax sp.]
MNKEKENKLKAEKDRGKENPDDIKVKTEADEVAEGQGETVEEPCEGVQEEKVLSKEDEEINVKYMRLAADFQNYKRRVEKEKSDIYAYANEKIVVEMLDVIDNFERALEIPSDGGGSFIEGMEKIFKQFKGVLEKSGVEEIQSMGEDFDPNFHHAVLTGQSQEYESEKVIEVLQKGYTLNKKVIRPAMVKVAE